MDCRDVSALAEAFAAGELDARRWAAVRLHVRACTSCREALAARDELAAMLTPMADPPLPTGLSRRVMDAARQAEAQVARQAEAQTARQQHMAAAGQRRAAQTQTPAPATDWNPIQWWRAATATLRWSAVGLAMLGAIVGGVAGDWLAGETAGVVSPAPSPEAGADWLDGHSFEYLLDAPEGSLAECYLAVQQGEWEGR